MRVSLCQLVFLVVGHGEERYQLLIIAQSVVLWQKRLLKYAFLVTLVDQYVFSCIQKQIFLA